MTPKLEDLLTWMRENHVTHARIEDVELTIDPTMQWMPLEVPPPEEDLTTPRRQPEAAYVLEEPLLYDDEEVPFDPRAPKRTGGSDDAVE